MNMGKLSAVVLVLVVPIFLQRLIDLDDSRTSEQLHHKSWRDDRGDAKFHQSASAKCENKFDEGWE